MAADTLEPYRMEIRFTTAAHNADEVEALYDALDKYAESIGLLSEGGSFGPMNHDDVIPDSPLARKLGWARGENT